jgi:peptidoglycan/xylan/chitin deacetylase (PgdA/CDA1 family)
MLGDLYYETLSGAGITALARRLRHGALVLCYHNVIDRADAIGDQALHLPLHRFTEQMEWLKAHYTVVPLGDIVDRLGSGKPVRGLAAITFDDGYAGAFACAWPLLSDLGLPATMFVVAGAPSNRPAFWWDHPDVVRANSNGARNRRLLSLRGDSTLVLADAGAGPLATLPSTYLPADWATIREAVSAGLDIGAHTVTHRTLTMLDDPDLSIEIETSSDIIQDLTGVRPDLFSYPYGIWDGRVRDAVRRAGYRAAVTLDFGLNRLGIDPFELRRINVPSSISNAAFAGWAAGIRPRSARAA